jgi:ribosomal protein S27AE
MTTNHRCPRCEGAMRTWDELSDNEREVVKRLPASAESDAEERQRLHRWCTRCWYETTQPKEAVG